MTSKTKIKELSFEDGIQEMVDDKILSKKDAEMLLTDLDEYPEGSEELPLDVDLRSPEQIAQEDKETSPKITKAKESKPKKKK